MLGKLLAAVGGTIIFVLGLMFSLVLLAVLATLGLLAWGYFLWKTRKIRKQMSEVQQGGQVIEGEAILVEERVNQQDILPHETSSKEP
ncbi:MAG: hypothetical protein HY847_04110 [Betaproteobacteria bacterium]|nr:hypothetical protein [Betaproteobacteria bacterium]